MQRSIAIIDKPGSKTDNLTNVSLVWAACLCCKSVYVSSFPNEMLYFMLAFDGFTEREKYTFYMTYIKSRSDVPPEAIADLENLYSQIVQLRKMKNKHKEMIVGLKKAEKVLLGAFSEAKTNVSAVCENTKISALLPITCTDSDKWDKPLLVWFFPIDNTEKAEIERIKVVAGTVVDDAAFSLFPNIIEQYCTHATLEEASAASTDVDFMSELLLEFVEPIELTAPQVLALRNDVNQTSDNLFIALEKLNTLLLKIPYKTAEFKRLADLYHADIPQAATALQKNLDTNADLQTIRKEGNKKTYKLYAAISSYQTILNMYHKLDIIDTNVLAYAGEEVSEEENLEHARLFLYLKTE
jgi:hypothetical protein